MKFDVDDKNRCRLVCVKFHLNRCRFAVAVAKCLGGSLFGTQCSIGLLNILKIGYLLFIEKLFEIFYLSIYMYCALCYVIKDANIVVSVFRCIDCLKTFYVGL